MNQTEFNNYWTKRITLREASYYRTTDELLKALNKTYARNFNMLQRELALIFKKYLETGKGIYKATYVKQLMTDISPELTKLFLKQNKEIARLFGEVYENEFYHAVYDLGKSGMNFYFTPLDSRAIQKVLNYPWSGALFSDRLWENKDKLIYSLKETLTQGLIQGQDYSRMTKNLAGRMDVSFEQAARLVKTETAHFMNQADMDSYDEAGIEKYQYLASLDELTCEQCGEMDGRIFKLSEAVTGVNYPPLHPNCYSKDTEIYTKDGWKLIKDIETGELVLTLIPETKQLEWNRVIETVSYKADKLLNLTNRQHSFDMLVTTDHPYFGYQRVGDDRYNNRRLEPKWYRMDELNSEFNFYISSEWQGIDNKTININGIVFDTEDYCKLMGYFLSEGSVVRRNNTRWQISIAQSNHLLEMWENLKDLPVNHVWLGKDKIYISDNRLGDYLSGFGKSYEKWIPENIKVLDKKYIKVFLDAYLLGDGSIKVNKKWKNGCFENSRTYFTSSKQMADGLGELIIKSGKAISYGIDKTKGKIQQFRNGKYKINHNTWKIYELTSQYKHFSNIKIKEIEYNDEVYDLEVDNHTILTRRNGKVVWGSNCRCSTIAVIEGRKKTGTRKAKEEGEWVEVPAGMSYKQWRESVK